MWLQKEIRLRARPRGFHLVTDEILDQFAELRGMRVGMLHIFIKHTSASLTVNENADPTVRGDFERYFRQAIPDGASYLQHRDEGPDDMPAHLKASLLGSSVTLPVSKGWPNLGTWQGIYLCEHREHGGSRTLVLTAQGD